MVLGKFKGSLLGLILAGGLLYGNEVKSDEINKKDNLSERISYKTESDNFIGDSDRILLSRLIFGEARGCSDVEKIIIGYTVINRVNDGKKWNGETIRDVILKPKQYSCFDEGNKNRKKLMDPEVYDSKVWSECLDVSEFVLYDRNSKYNIGATHFFAKSSRKIPFWAMSEQMIPLEAPINFQHWFFREK